MPPQPTAKSASHPAGPPPSPIMKSFLSNEFFKALIGSICFFLAFYLGQRSNLASTVPAGTAASTTSSLAADDLAIRNTLSLYSVSIDSKDYSHWDAVFTNDVKANYIGLGLGFYNTSAAAHQAIEAALSRVHTQHTLGTLLFRGLVEGSRRVDTSTYFIANHLGNNTAGVPGDYTVFGRYEDVLVKVDGGDGLAPSTWLISERTGIAMGSTGDISVFIPPSG